MQSSPHARREAYTWCNFDAIFTTPPEKREAFTWCNSDAIVTTPYERSIYRMQLDATPEHLTYKETIIYEEQS